MLSETRLPPVQQSTTSSTFVPVDGTSTGFNVIEREAVVDLEFSGVYQHEATSTPGGPFNLSAIQARIVTPLVMVGDDTWRPAPLDTLDIENDTATLEFDAVDGDIDIKQTGLYQVHYTLGLDPQGNHLYQFRLAKNGTTILPGSVTDVTVTSAHTELGIEVLHEFTAGDTLRLEYNANSASGASIEHATFTVFRLQSAEVASSGATISLSFVIDGEDVALPFTEGLVAQSVSSDGRRINLRHRLLVAPGRHTAGVVWKTNNATGVGAKLRADVWPASMVVEVRSNPGTLGHGHDSKVQGIY